VILLRFVARSYLSIRHLWLVYDRLFVDVWFFVNRRRFLFCVVRDIWFRVAVDVKESPQRCERDAGCCQTACDSLPIAHFENRIAHLPTIKDDFSH